MLRLILALLMVPATKAAPVDSDALSSTTTLDPVTLEKKITAFWCVLAVLIFLLICWIFFIGVGVYVRMKDGEKWKDIMHPKE
ncbi:hypothetical protein L596_016092 [Steinernema carpocapsae]|uniref:Uncharacterized protein n=1 Tax=Steinernema carpocapsae TaxID=34508 RepID=A0A4U5NI10_STECR|nr:hypothetical protein L596_016092 [Steinernema carpocapsae]